MYVQVFICNTHMDKIVIASYGSKKHTSQQTAICGSEYAEGQSFNLVHGFTVCHM